VGTINTPAFVAKYRFTCPACDRVNVGAELIVFGGVMREAVLHLPALTCKFCSSPLPAGADVLIDISEAPPSDAGAASGAS
jgi:hypothetical protein